MSINQEISLSRSLWSDLLLSTSLECRIELDRSLKMLFSKLVHPEVLQSEADHQMVKRIVGGELVGLLFMPVALWDRCRLPVSGCVWKYRPV